MTSSVFIGSNLGAYNEMERIAKLLEDDDCNVVRKKIETVPWHPAAPNLDNSFTMPKDCYFESHLQVLIKTETDYEDLMRIAKRTDSHISRNAFKKYDDGSYTIMLTYRVYDAYYEDFKEDVDSIKSAIERNGIEVGKTIVEFSIYDTKVSHDNSWITSS